MSDYIEVMAVDELAEGEMREVDIDEHQLLVAKVDSQIYITDGRCPHMHAHLAKGELDGTIVTCPLHHSQFDISDGHVVRWTDFTGVVKTMGDMIRHPRPLRTYDVKIEDGKVFVGPEKSPVG